MFLDSSNPSPDILEGQRILLEKRAELGITGQQRPLLDVRLPNAPKIDETKSHLPETAVSPPPAAGRDNARLTGAASQHEAAPFSVGYWQRENAINYLKLRQRQAGIVVKRKANETAVTNLRLPASVKTVVSQAHDPDQRTAVTHETAVRVFPSFAAAVLNNECRINDYIVDVAARLFLVLKTIDANEYDGRGWLSWSEAARLVADKNSPFYLYGRRQLKAILKRGEGAFWHRVNHRHETRIRLVSRARAAAAVGIDRLTGRETAVPLRSILGLIDERTGKTAVDGRARMANFRAAMLAVWHGGRQHEEQKKPISRRKIARVYNVSKYRQRSYAARAGIETRRNITPICSYKKEALTAVRLVDGIPAYKHFDRWGILGPRGAAYVARMLPNTYTPPSFVSQQKRNKTRKANKTLAGLGIMSGLGSGSDKRRVFHRHAKAAAAAAGRNPDRDAYAELTTRVSAGVWKNYQYRQEWQP